MTKRKTITTRHPTEELRPIPGFDGRYGVTRSGRIWSHAKSMGVSRHGGRWLKAAVRSDGYKVVALFVDERQRMVSVHRAVALAWVSNPDPERLVEVNHLDFDRLNCDASNLEWCTPLDNKRHAVSAGRRTYTTKISSEQAAWAIALCRDGATQRSVAASLGISESLMSKLVRGYVPTTYRKEN